MGSKHSKQPLNKTDEPVFRHEKTCYLIDKFQPKTLEIVIDPCVRHMSEIGLGISQAIAATWSFHVDSVMEHARLNNGILTARIEIVENSKTFLDLASFLINSKEDAEKVTLHMMILHALLIENEGSVLFNFLRDRYGRSGNSVEWVEPRITDPLGIIVQVWFQDAIENGILDVKGTASINGRPVFKPTVYHPSDNVVTMMECGVMIQSVQLAGTNAFWKCSRFR